MSLKDAYFLVNEVVVVVVVVVLLLLLLPKSKQEQSKQSQLRPIISPNAGFWQQMIDFEAAKNGGSNFF